MLSIASLLSGFVWGGLAWMLAPDSARKVVWGGIVVAPLIGLLMGYAGRLFKHFRGWARAFAVLIALYVAVGLFGFSIGLYRLVIGDWMPSPGGGSAFVTLRDSTLSYPIGMSVSGYVLFLWPLAYLNFLLVWRAGDASAARRAG